MHSLDALVQECTFFKNIKSAYKDFIFSGVLKVRLTITLSILKESLIHFIY